MALISGKTTGFALFGTRASPGRGRGISVSTVAPSLFRLLCQAQD
jgi:hypothetical protein